MIINFNAYYYHCIIIIFITLNHVMTRAYAIGVDNSHLLFMRIFCIWSIKTLKKTIVLSYCPHKSNHGHPYKTSNLPGWKFTWAITNWPLVLWRSLILSHDPGSRWTITEAIRKITLPWYSNYTSTMYNSFYEFIVIIWCLLRCSTFYYDTVRIKWNDWCFRPQPCTVRLYWAGHNLGEWDEFCYEC